MEELLKVLGFTTPLIYATAAYGLFHWLDEKASDEAKAALARTMRLKDYKNDQVASALVEVFDQIYTCPLLRWRAFGRSLLFTTVVSAIFVYELYRYDDAIRWSALVDWGVLLVGLFFNVFTDYLSLFVIRPLLVRNGAKPVIALVVGTLSAAAVVYAANVLRLIAGTFFFRASPPTFADWFTLVVPHWNGLTFVWPALAVFVWLPLFALGIVVARLLTPLSWIVGRTQWFLKEGKEHPLKAIGYVAAVVVFLVPVAGRAVFSV